MRYYSWLASPTTITEATFTICIKGEERFGEIISHFIGLNFLHPSPSRSQAAQKVLGKLQLRRNLSRPVGLPLPVGHCRSRQSGKRQCELTMVALWPYIVPHCSHCGSVGEGIKGTCASRPIHLNSREGERREGGWVFIPPQPCSIINTNSIIQHLIIFTSFTQLVLICSTYLKLKELLQQP